MDVTWTSSRRDLTPAGALDWIADRTVVPGFTRLGYAIRRHGWEPDSALSAELDGKHVLVTGAGSGIGAAIAERLALDGASVHLVARDRVKAEAAVAEVRARLAARAPDVAATAMLEPWACDLADLDSVDRLAGEINASVPSLDGVVHNAGVLTDRRLRSPQGHELTLATHVLGPLRLTLALRDPLRSAGDARVVFVASGGLYTSRLHADDIELEREDFDGPRAYAHAKRIQLIVAGLLAERWRKEGICVTAMHPGWVDTPGLKRSLPRFHRFVRPLLRTPEQGADTAVWLLAAADPCRAGEALWHDRAPRPAHRVPWTRESAADRELLWRELTAKAGTDRTQANQHAGGP